MGIEDLTPYQSRVSPLGEDLDCLVRATEPEGKDILNIACYGGYAIALLLNGAKKVTSIDINEETVENNIILQKSIELGDYDFWKNLLQNNWDISLFAEISDSIVKSDWMRVNRYFNEVNHEFYFGSWCDKIRRFGNFYRHVRSEENFMKVKNKIKEGNWQVQQAELLGFLKTLPSESLDAICGSSVRNYVFHSSDLGETPDAWKQEYECPLFREVHRCLRKDGRYVEAVIPYDIWPRYQSPLPNYLNFRFKTIIVEEDEPKKTRDNKYRYCIAIKK